MCDGEIELLLDLDTGETTYRRFANLAITGDNTITLTTTQLASNHHYRIATGVSNSAGSATSHIKISKTKIIKKPQI